MLLLPRATSPTVAPLLQHFHCGFTVSGEWKSPYYVSPLYFMSSKNLALQGGVWLRSCASGRM
jgi:hypothetical protein